MRGVTQSLSDTSPDGLILANDVDSNLAALREARTTAQATALEHLQQYAAHRTRGV